MKTPPNGRPDNTSELSKPEIALHRKLLSISASTGNWPSDNQICCRNRMEVVDCKDYSVALFRYKHAGYITQHINYKLHRPIYNKHIQITKLTLTCPVRSVHHDDDDNEKSVAIATYRNAGLLRKSYHLDNVYWDKDRNTAFNAGTAGHVDLKYDDACEPTLCCVVCNGME